MEPSPLRCACRSAVCRSLIAILTSFLISGCVIRVAEQEVLFRHDAAADALDLLLIYRGVAATDDKESTLEDAMKIAYDVLDGRRIFYVGALFMAEDLDEILEKIERPGADETDAMEPGERAALTSVIDSVSVEDVDVFLDEHQRLSAYQLYRIENVSGLLDWINSSISRAVNDSAEGGRLAEDLPLLDPSTRELWASRAQSGQPWIVIDDDLIVIDLPMTIESFQRVQAELIDAVTQSEEVSGAALVGQYLAHLRDLEVADDRIVLRFGAPGGVYRLTATETREEREGDSRLLDALRDDGLVIDEEMTNERVRAIVAPLALEER